MSSIILAVLGWRMTSQANPIGMLQLAAMLTPIAVAVASSIVTATVYVYKSGARRQEQRQLKDSLVADLERVRVDVSRSFARIEERLSTIERSVAALLQAQARIEAILTSIDGRVDRLEVQPRKEAA